MVQTREGENTHGTEKLESIVDWKVVNWSLIEIGIHKVTASMEDAVHAYFGAYSMLQERKNIEISSFHPFSSFRSTSAVQLLSVHPHRFSE
jgi:hypothetical protein